ncbi:hypothetical protein ACLESD_00400 [Pyxidicoccus sp. 3LFB2]
MNVDECLDRFGLAPTSEHLGELRALLDAQSARERQSQGHGDTELMKLCALQLFNAGRVEDILRIWRAKTSSMDADASLDIQLLAGAGLEQAKAYLSREGSEHARSALARLTACESSGDFDGFSVAGYGQAQAGYYGDD